MDINELFTAPEGESLDNQKIINELKSKRFIEVTDHAIVKDQLDPLKHKVFDQRYRPDKRVKVDTEDPDYRRLHEYGDEMTRHVTKLNGNEGQKEGYRIEPVARVALALQKLIVKRAVSFIFGNPVTLDADAETEGEKAVYKALKRVMHDVKEKSFNRKVARSLFSCTEVAELWYPIASDNNIYGFGSKFKLHCTLFSPLHGDILFPYFDETGDMVAFSREFTLSDENNKTTSYFETYTDKFHFVWKQSTDGYVVAEGFPKENAIGKIPVVFGHQPQVEWADVQNLIERLEKLLSNFADTNDYHASPKIVVKGEISGFSKKGESGGIIQLEGDDASAEYLSWANAPESVKLEIETLLRMIYTITQTPDISFDSVKGIGAVSGIALKLLFMDAHLKVADHQEVFDEYLQRRINIIKSFIGKFNTNLATDADNLFVEPVIKPYMIVDEAAEIKIWTDANGGNPIMSQKASFAKASMTADPEADYKQYTDEQANANSFTLGAPTN